MTEAKLQRRPSLLLVLSVLLVVGTMTVLWAGWRSYLDAMLPSWFASHLGEGGYLYWRRWSPLSLGEGWMLGVFAFVLFSLAYWYIDPIYRYFHKAPAGRSAFAWTCAALPFLAVFAYAPFTGGYALYRDHIVVMDPFRDLTAKRYDIAAIDHIETGCHLRTGFPGRGASRPNWQVPSYKIVMRDGRAVSVFDLADFAYKDERLMRAVLAFDAEARGHEIPRHLRHNLFGMAMDGRPYCYAGMEAKYDPALTPAIRSTFETAE